MSMSVIPTRLFYLEANMTGGGIAAFHEGLNMDGYG